MKLLLRNLSRSSTEDELKEIFEKYGRVQYCNIVLDKSSGTSKGFGFVEMPKAGEARVAMKALNGTKIGGNVIRVKRAEEKAAPKTEETPPEEMEE